MIENYKNLANAIVLAATEDYRKALRKLVHNPDSSSADHEKRSIERFFRCAYFGILTRLDPEMLIKRLNQEVAA